VYLRCRQLLCCVAQLLRARGLSSSSSTPPNADSSGVGRRGGGLKARSTLVSRQESGLRIEQGKPKLTCHDCGDKPPAKMILLTAGMGLTFMTKQQSHAGRARAHADAAPAEDAGPCTAPAAGLGGGRQRCGTACDAIELRANGRRPRRRHHCLMGRQRCFNYEKLRLQRRSCQCNAGTDSSEASMNAHRQARSLCVLPSYQQGGFVVNYPLLGSARDRCQGITIREQVNKLPEGVQERAPGRWGRRGRPPAQAPR